MSGTLSFEQEINTSKPHVNAVQNYVQFAVAHGFPTDADVQGHIHANLRSMPTSKAHKRRWDAAMLDLQTRRDAGKAAYRVALNSGSVVAPPAPTLEERASGHPDNPSTQAAQRLLEKRAMKGQP